MKSWQFREITVILRRQKGKAARKVMISTELAPLGHERT